MTKNELLARFTDDISDLSGSTLTDPMNTRHAEMYEAYERGYDLGVAVTKGKPPTGRAKVPGESERTRVNRRITKHFDMNNTLVAYYDTYNLKLKFRNKISKACEEDIHTKTIGAFTDPDKAKNVLSKYI